MHIMQSRRDFLASASLAAAGVLRARGSFAEEGPLETTTIRLGYWRGYACLTPHSIAEDLLRAEGFTDVRFVPPSDVNSVARGTFDFDLDSAPWVISQVDAGEPITVLAGVHVGCFELFVHEPIRTIADLRGKRVGVDFLGSSPHLYLSVMVAQIGLDPKSDIDWVANPIESVASAETGSLHRFIDGDVDAFLGFPPEPQELRSRKVGRVILNTAMDAPWSHYFCCMAFGRRQFVRDYPIATKRYLRAILKAADICASQPEWAARWREFDPEDSMRFYGLRLHEVGMIKSSPNALLAEGADWRFLNELKRELKA